MFNFWKFDWDNNPKNIQNAILLKCSFFSQFSRLLIIFFNVADYLTKSLYKKNLHESSVTDMNTLVRCILWKKNFLQIDSSQSAFEQDPFQQVRWFLEICSFKFLLFCVFFLFLLLSRFDWRFVKFYFCIIMILLKSVAIFIPDILLYFIVLCCKKEYLFSNKNCIFIFIGIYRNAVHSEFSASKLIICCFISY